ncbi:MAG TPA: heterodisulfide reductase-related iron-sulfur binding cluster [Kiloniellales bacterium]
MREGSLDAPTRHAIDWNDPDFYDPGKIDAELRRVFDICHGCRRCFNLCDSFPRLFDLIDESESGELDTVASADFKPVVDACTLCDMCFMTKCPYVPPHEFDLDFPHLMLRYRAAEAKAGKVDVRVRQLTETDRNGRLAGHVAGLANWASDTKNRLTRPLLERVAGVHREAALPRFHGRTLVMQSRTEAPEVNREAPAFGRKAVIYATCFANYNNPGIGLAARAVLARNGVETEVVYPACCGMPQFEHGEIAKAAAAAKRVAGALEPWIDKGYDVITLVPSCALMVKFEWPLILPEDAQVQALSRASYDIAEYVVDIAKKEGLADGLRPLPGGVALHIACHARAQNMGHKAAEMLRLLPEADVAVIERCSGHGGSWGVMKENFEVALKVGRPVARAAAESAKAFVASECPLAGMHIVQGMERLKDGEARPAEPAIHPIELFARAYGVMV